MGAKTVEEILQIRQEQDDLNKSVRKIILKDTLNLEGKISYKEMLEMSCIERKLLSEACSEINDEKNNTEVLRN